MRARVHRTPAQLDPISRLLGFLVFLSSARPRQTSRALRPAIGPCLLVFWAALSICLLRSDQRCLALPPLATTSNPVELPSGPHEEVASCVCPACKWCIQTPTSLLALLLGFVEHTAPEIVSACVCACVYACACISALAHTRSVHSACTQHLHIRDTSH